MDSQLALQWATSARNIPARALGDDGEHFKLFSKLTNDSISARAVEKGMGVLAAAIDDVRGGYLFDVRQVIEAEIFDDFLEQSEHLLSLGYHMPAAVIAGAVLEDGLRTMMQRLDLPLADKPKLNQMNSDLAKANAYNKLTQKQITALADVRNKAAHGQVNEFTKDDVADMIRSVQRFMTEHCA